MLSLNTIKISCSDSSILEEIYNILYTKSVEYDIDNYHSYSKSNIEFLSLFFEGENPLYNDFLFEWAYIESCEKSDSITTNIYSYNGNLSIWVSELVKKYNNYNLDTSIEIVKSVKFKNYDVIPTWIEAELPKVIQKKKGL